MAASAEGYAFPTNPDLDQSTTGLADEAPAELVRRAIEGQMTVEALVDALRDMHARHQA